MTQRSQPALWLSVRGVWVGLSLAVLLAVGSVVAIAFAMFVVASTVAVALVVADAALGPTARTLRVARRPLGTLALRRPASVTYEVENRALVPIRIGLFETPVELVEFGADSVAAAIDARAKRTLEVPLLARERGVAHFGTIYVWVENRVGLLRRRYRVEADETVRIFPDLAAVERYGTLAKRSTLVDAGLRRLRQRGTGSEFESLRDYAAGDAFGTVDWKASARSGRLMVAQYEVERSQQIVIALDCGRLMTPRLGPMRKFDYALTAALSVARIAQAANDNVGLLAFAAKPLRNIAPRRGAAHAAALARATFDLQPLLEEPDYETIFGLLRARHTKRSLVVLFTDIDPVTAPAILVGLGSLVPRHLVLCVSINDAAIATALELAPATVADAYRTAVAMTLADERAIAIALLRERGILVVDVPAQRLTVALLDRYLDVKARGLL